ncbi:MAG: RNA-directed DNA polymerase [Polyangiaceae bacterium]|nr:RNA-directed DNA polymerase [Polyangiaceae bacterium]
MGLWDKVKTLLGLGDGAQQPGAGEDAGGGQGSSPAAPAQPARPAAAQGSAKPAAAQPPAAVQQFSAAPAPAAAQRPAKQRQKPTDPYDAKGILGLSADEVRKRALKINPYKTAWIGRVDTIPPQSDERTALIDRGLILRGLLTEAQIAEIHRVGDIWLKHHEAARLAGTVAAKTAEKAIADIKREKEARKAEKKRLAAERRERRAAEIARRRAEDIIYLGRGVSAGLADRRAHVEALEERGLPVLSTPGDVARALGLTISQLRWLAFHGDAVERPHYVYFEVPKRSGGKRLLSSPHRSLAAAQAWILHDILERLPVEAPAHGFVQGRSTVTNARPHIGRDVVVNLDLSDFFPTITFPRVRGVFQRLGYSPAAATVLALLCTEPPRRELEYDGQRYWVAVGERGLPQGACTSPALSNQVARKLDRRLAGMCKKHGFEYTRYADDLTFSAPPGKRAEIPMLLARVRHIVTEEGFAINPKKGRIQRAAGRQEVTGIVVNDKLGMPREEVRRLRAILHAAKKTGLAAQNREGLPDFEAHIRGKLAYLQMIDRQRAAPLLAALDALAG